MRSAAVGLVLGDVAVRGRVELEPIGGDAAARALPGGVRRAPSVGVLAQRRCSRAAAKMYRGGGYDQPGVCLVLGAGNVGTITTLDVIDQLYAGAMSAR